MLEKILKKIDRRGYKAYKEIQGAVWKVKNITFKMLKVQSDPFAPPSIVLVRAMLQTSDPIPTADFYHRRLYKNLKRLSKRLGEGKSGLLALPKPSNAILRRSSARASKGFVEFKVWVGLPSKQRRVLAEEALELLTDKLPKAVLTLKGEGLGEHARTWRVQQEIRRKLPSMRLVSFIGDGSILPRKCGTCDEPLESAVPFESPPSLAVEIETEIGLIRGMGIRRGVTSITGPAFHGKTTLAEAIAWGVWDHIPGDGRERVVTVKDSTYVRSEDGRRTCCVDISTFVKLPRAECFTTSDASGATSVASSFQEGVEAGANLIIVDEDYTASNFLFFDDRLEDLYEERTVETLSEKLWSIKEKGLSIIVVVSSSAPILKVSDTIIYMKKYKPVNKSEYKEKLRVRIEKKEYDFPRMRYLVYKAPRKLKVNGPWLVSKEWEGPVKLDSNLHLVENGQLEFIARLMERDFKGRLQDIIIPDPWDYCLSPSCSEVRPLDLAFALSRAPLSCEETWPVPSG